MCDIRILLVFALFLTPFRALGAESVGILYVIGYDEDSLLRSHKTLQKRMDQSNPNGWNEILTFPVYASPITVPSNIETLHIIVDTHGAQITTDGVSDLSISVTSKIRVSLSEILNLFEMPQKTKLEVSLLTCHAGACNLKGLPEGTRIFGIVPDILIAWPQQSEYFRGLMIEGFRPVPHSAKETLIAVQRGPLIDQAFDWLEGMIFGKLPAALPWLAEVRNGEVVVLEGIKEVTEPVNESIRKYIHFTDDWRSGRTRLQKCRRFLRSLVSWPKR